MQRAYLLDVVRLIVGPLQNLLLTDLLDRVGLVPARVQKLGPPEFDLLKRREEKNGKKKWGKGTYGWV
jgi:hypothetical protein